MRAVSMAVVLLALAGAGCGTGADGGAGAAGAGGSGGSGGSAGVGGTGGSHDQEPPVEICGNRVDDDGDGADDYADPDCRADDAFHAALRTVADDARGSVPALVVGVERPDGSVAFATSGTREKRGDVAVAPDDRFPIGSITKSFTATLILQLRDEGRLSLADSLARWLPDFPRAGQIRIRHLLSHTSGIYDYLSDTPFQERLVAGETITVDEMISIAAENDPLFSPGRSWSYSNSNYVLLGAVIEKVTGGTYAEALRTRIFEPMGMHDSLLLGSEPIEGGLQVHGYFPQGLGEMDMVTLWNGTGAWSAGAIVSTAADMLRFSHGLTHGELLPAASFAEMRTIAFPFEEGAGYGYGLLLADDRLGHDGAVLGWMSNWMRRDDGATVVALQSRLDDGDAMNDATHGVFELLPAP